MSHPQNLPLALDHRKLKQGLIGGCSSEDKILACQSWPKGIKEYLNHNKENIELNL